MGRATRSLCCPAAVAFGARLLTVAAGESAQVWGERVSELAVRGREAVRFPLFAHECRVAPDGCRLEADKVSDALYHSPRALDDVFVGNLQPRDPVLLEPVPPHAVLVDQDLLQLEDAVEVGIETTGLRRTTGLRHDELAVPGDRLSATVAAREVNVTRVDEPREGDLPIRRRDFLAGGRPSGG